MSEYLGAILKLLEHCSPEELAEVATVCNRGKLTVHEPCETVPTEVPWRPGVLPGDFGPQRTHTPTGGQLPPSSMDETINKGRFK